MVTFLKKNIIFFIVFVVVMLASLFLLFLDVTMYSEISELNGKTDNAQKTLEEYGGRYMMTHLPVVANGNIALALPTSHVETVCLLSKKCSV